MKKPTKGHPNRLANLGAWAHKAGAKAPSAPKSVGARNTDPTRKTVRKIHNEMTKGY